MRRLVVRDPEEIIDGLDALRKKAVLVGAPAFPHVLHEGIRHVDEEVALCPVCAAAGLQHNDDALLLLVAEVEGFLQLQRYGRLV